MKKHELETRVLGVIDRVIKNQSTEDDLIELKSEWPKDHKKAARQIAAHANAARGQPILWIIGLDEKRGVIGANYNETSDWFNQIKSCFDDFLSPDLRNLAIPYRGKTLIALYFETDRAPYVVKNLKGGQITFEVPWREGNSTRSAKRAELLRLLSPLQKNPQFEILSGTLILTTKGIKDKEIILRLESELYITTNSHETIIIPFHTCKARWSSHNQKAGKDFLNIRLDPPTRLERNASLSSMRFRNLSLTVESTNSEVLIDTAGLLKLTGDSIVEKSEVDKARRINVKAVVNLPNTELPVTIDFNMRKHKRDEHKAGFAQWKHDK